MPRRRRRRIASCLSLRQWTQRLDCMSQARADVIDDRVGRIRGTSKVGLGRGWGGRDGELCCLSLANVAIQRKTMHYNGCLIYHRKKTAKTLEKCRKKWLVFTTLCCVSKEQEAAALACGVYKRCGSTAREVQATVSLYGRNGKLTCTELIIGWLQSLKTVWTVTR
jgi:hypothetical protein